MSTPPGDATRPLLTRLRKALADILRPRLAGSRLLDLFGGSGAIAFELLSNGAASAVICELDAAAATRVAANAESLGVAGSVRVLRGDALEWLGRLAADGETFDVIVVAPPYGHGLQSRTLDALGRHPLLAAGGVAVVQRDAREPQVPAPPTLTLRRSRGYGRTAFDFYEAR